MIRGILGVVPADKVEPGRFYLGTGYGQGNWLFQCVLVVPKAGDEPVPMALVFTIDGQLDLHLSELPARGPVVALYDVSVRIDPTSLSGAATSTSPRPGMLRVIGDTPVLGVQRSGYYDGWWSFDLGSGQTISTKDEFNWLTFDRWSLVLDDDTGDELKIASFEYPQIVESWRQR